MPLNEILNGRWRISDLEIAAPAQFAGYIFRNVFRPALGGIEGDDADRVAILAGQQVLNYRLKSVALYGEEIQKVSRCGEEGGQEGWQQPEEGRAPARTLGTRMMVVG